MNLPTALLLASTVVILFVALGFGGNELWGLLIGRRPVSEVTGTVLPLRRSLGKIAASLQLVVVDVVAAVVLIQHL